MAGFEELGVAEAKARMDDGWAPYVLDVRGAAEAEIVKFAFCDCLQPHTQVAAIAAELPKDRDILVHCKMGGRSRQACEILAANGVTRLFNLDGGITAWAKQIDPSLPTY